MGWKNILQAAAALCATALAGFLLIFGPVELNFLNQVRHWPATQIRVTALTLRSSSFRPYNEFWVLQAIDLETHQPIEIRDAAPGDIPFRLMVLGHALYDQQRSKLAMAGEPGSIATAYHAPDHSRYVLARGSPLLLHVLMALSAGWWLMIVWRWRHRRKAV